jgi:hypothetical protein
MSAEAMPPPAHIAATAVPPPRRRSSWTSVSTIRVPVIATGWPRLQPLPRTFTIVSSIPSSRVTATGTEAKASLISHRSMSLILSPARSRAFGIAIDGASPVSAGKTPALAHARTIASGSRPRPSANDELVTMTAAAPSLTPAALPAVMLKPSMPATARMCER